MNEMKQELVFEGNFSHLQKNSIQLLVSGSAFMPNHLSNLTISAYTKSMTSEPPCLRFLFNMIAQIVEFTFIRSLLR